MKTALIKDALSKGNVLVTGPSGVGKSKLLDDMISVLAGDYKFVNLDKFGTKKNDKWVISGVPTAKNGLIYEGTPDFDETVRDSMNIKLIILPIPELRLYHSIQLAKAREGKEKNLSIAWIKGWQQRADFSSEQMKADIRSSLDRGKLRTLNVPVYEIPIEQVGSVERGWHQSKTKND